MLNNNLEFVYKLNNKTDKYYSNLKKIINQDFPCSDIRYQKNIDNFSRTTILTFSIEEEIFNKGYLNLLKENIEKIEEGYELISCKKTFNKYISQLFDYKDFNFIHFKDRFMYIKLNNNSKHLFLQKFLEKFKINIEESEEDLEFYLNLKMLKLPKINYNYSVNKLIYDIYNSNIYGDDSKFFKIECDMDIDNINFLKESRMLKFPYFKDSIKTKYILLKNLLKVNKESNLPTNNVKDIVFNLEDSDYILTFNYFYFKKISSGKDVKKFQYNKFDDQDKAVSHLLDLKKEDINGNIIFYNNDVYVCYENETNIKFTDNVEQNKKDLISKLESLTSKEYSYTEKNLKSLVNVQVYEKELFFEEEEKLSTSKGNPLPLKYILNKGTNFYNINSNIGNFNNNFLEFNRENLFISVSFSIILAEKIENVYSVIIELEKETVILESDVFIPRNLNMFQERLSIMFEKGYFLTKFGIMRYLNSGKIYTRDIKCPAWFVSDNEEEFKFIEKFLNNI